MNIKETFLKLTSRTYPHGTEDGLMHLLPNDLETDEFGNKFIQIGESPSCMFTSHLDTATSANTPVDHVFEGNIIKTDNTSILGADDKAGVTIMLYMIENKVPGLYYFFLGEEVGCIGSKKVSEKQRNKKIDHINKVISFDRRGYDSVITFQASSRCCSDEFAESLAKELNKAELSFSYKIDPTGIYTDSAQFTRIYPECTNISVGYKSEHTFAEQQDILHLELLAKACTSINWEDLPATRDPSKYEYSRYSYYGGSWDDDWDYGYGFGYNTSRINSTNNLLPKKVEVEDSMYFMDEEYNYVSGLKIHKYTRKITTIDLCDDRVESERFLIKNFLNSLEIDFDSFIWDGFKLVVKRESGNDTECDRNELSDFIPDLEFWKERTEVYDNVFKTKDYDDFY